MSLRRLGRADGCAAITIVAANSMAIDAKDHVHLASTGDYIGGCNRLQSPAGGKAYAVYET
jgi:hypothetical protein